jgi:hypothetical protein
MSQRNAPGPGMLLLADRGFLGFDLWREAAVTGADLLWRVKSSAVLPVIEQLPDGSYLSHIYAPRDKNRHADPITVRVVDAASSDSRRRQWCSRHRCRYYRGQISS